MENYRACEVMRFIKRGLKNKVDGVNLLLPVEYYHAWQCNSYQKRRDPEDDLRISELYSSQWSYEKEQDF